MAKVKIGNLRPPLATVDAVGIIKPDGTTITADADGTLHGTPEVDLTGFVFVDDETVALAAEPVINAEKLGGEPLSYFAKQSDYEEINASLTDLNGSLGIQFNKITVKTFICNETVNPYEAVDQIYSLSDLNFTKTPYYAIQSIGWLNPQILDLTKDSITIRFYNSSDREITGATAFVQLIFFESK